ncbi:NB-ARC domain-containing protein [Sodalis sp. RH21]|uniref:NB-ARC domain-containing protein n=1 Tax=unclassified Sodalis (in: enterobacteria) TaxID=2636512 RepID=UPI0039B3DC8D
MKHFTDELIRKVEVSKSDSDFTFFFNLLVAGEAITKIITLIITSTLKKDKDRHQYRILHGLVRANGLGEWSQAIDDLLTGTASQYLPEGMRIHQMELTKKTDTTEWQYEAVDELNKAMKFFNLPVDTNTAKRDLKIWFKNFTELRNKTRGHGATQSNMASNAAIYLEKSIKIILANLSLLKIPSAYLKRNMSGKYRVTSISSLNDYLEMLKKNDSFQYEEGVYVYIDNLYKVPLLKSDPDLQDFYISNGGFKNTKYEMMSYLSDDKIQEDSSEYFAPKGKLPASESQGLGELLAYTNCFSNVPALSYDYINRKELEDELFKLLNDDRHIAITLLGRGGIGKTSLALKVIPLLYETPRFDAVIWFSSRDIDLSPNGVKLVRAEVITKKDIAKYYISLFVSEETSKDKKFDPIEYFQTQLVKADAGPTLFVFDNFETIDNPIETYKWIDTYIRSPNKALITTRLRDFKGDYPLQVQGMNFDESMELINITTKKLNIDENITTENRDKIYRISAGHPYIIKILIGDFVRNRMKGSLERLIAGSDEVLTALFERTYSVLTPCAQRIFLTLASWNSAVPLLGLESILMYSLEDPLEVEKSIEILIQYSMIEEVKAEDGYYFIQLPYVAFAFGNKKIKVNTQQFLISQDISLLRRFGVTKLEDKNNSLTKNFTKYLSTISHNEEFIKVHKIILQRICYTFNNGWKLLASWLLEANDPEFNNIAKDCITRYLENEKSDRNRSSAWYLFANVSDRLNHPFDQILGLTQVSAYDNISFDELSNITNRINIVFKSNEIELGEQVKKELLIKLFNVVYRRRNEADPTAYSRIAWLALHLNKEKEALELAKSGLQIDPADNHCLRLFDKLTKR